MTPASERDLFDRAAELPVAERAAFLDAHCADPALRARVEALLAAHGRAATGFLHAPASAMVEESVGRAGRRLGAYQLRRELGRGGMGAVYLATRADDEFQKEVAIKVVAAPFGDEDLLRRFRRERQILAGLEHPHVARLLDGGTTEDGLPYLVMEFVEGVRIDEYVRERSLTLDSTLRLFRTVCDAVQFAHRHLIVHRDLKPANILVTPEGSPRLLDFGIATLIANDEDAAAAGHTLTAAAAMTPDYASPEQLRGERATTASDVYSLGVLLYELLTGARPNSLQSGQLDVDPQRPSVAAARSGNRGLANSLNGDLDAIILMALRSEPERRYASVAALSDDIGRYLDGQPVAASGEAFWYRAAKFGRRHRLAVAAAAAVFVTLLGGVAATTWQAARANRERREAEAQRARAERRFADVRQLANSFLFEFHDAIAPLPGSTPARRLVVTKALQYLDGLAAESAGDVSLQRELAAAYDRVGDVQGNPTTPNIGDTAGALESYRKSEAIRKRLAGAQPASLPDRLALAASDMKIGDAMVGRGAIQDAVSRYHSALEPREEALRLKAPSSGAAHQAFIETSGRLCTSLLAVGDVQGALSNCERNREAGDALLAVEPDHRIVRGLRAANGIGYGNVLRMVGRPDDAAKAFADAIARHDQLLATAPGNAELRRRVAVTYGLLATVQLELKQPQAAADSLERAVVRLTELAAADPANVRSSPELAYFLNRRAQALIGAGRPDAARVDARRAIDLLRVATERPGAGGDAFNEYAWALVSYVPDDVRDPRIALRYANKALTEAASPNPAYLHTLGWAQYLTGDRASAVATLERAVSLLPNAGPALGLRKQIDSDLATFKAPTRP